MANRYWVGGGGNWSDTNHWSTASGGVTGSSIQITIQTDTAEVLDDIPQSPSGWSSYRRLLNCERWVSNGR